MTTSARQRLAFLGGSFDPIHLGHLHVARAACDHLRIDSVHFLPAPQPPHKRSRQLTPIETRLQLLHLAVDDEPRFVVDETEVEKGGTSYTFDTLTELATRHEDAEICFVIGGDSLVDLPGWYRAAELVHRFTMITVPRDPQQDLDDLLAPAVAHFPEEDVNKLRRNVLTVAPLPISSTEIRDLCRRGTTIEQLERLVPGPVAALILELGLYRSDG